MTQFELVRVQRYESIRDELAAMKPLLQAEFHVSEIGLFGSWVRGEQTEDSDLDVLVAFAEPISLLEFVRLENVLSSRIGVDVDLVTKNSLKPRIKARVTEDVVYV